MRTVSPNGESEETARTRLTTPNFTGPHYTVSAPGSAREGQALTITVSRTNRSDGESLVFVWLEDSFTSNDTAGTYAVEFDSNSGGATMTWTVPDDGSAVTDRKVRVRISEVRSEGATEDELTYNTFSVEWDTVSVTNTTPQ